MKRRGSGACGGDTEGFLVRVWMERREIPGAEPLLRGSVEHVGSGTRRFVKALEEVVSFISLYLQDAPSDAPDRAHDPQSGQPPTHGRAG